MAKKNKKMGTNEEVREEKSSQVSIVKPQDYHVDENIDDKYTKNFLAKYQKGEKTNKWFTVSGILSIVFGIVCIVAMIVVGIVFLSSIDYLKELALNGEADYEKKKSQITVACIVIPILGILSILVGIRICKYAKYTKSELSAVAVKIIFLAIAQFFIGGIIFCFLTIIGYFMGVSTDYGAIFYNRIDKGDLTEKQLHNAKLYHQNELINDEEYQDLKRDILKDKNIYF